jgi:hypothetical protein
VRLGPFDQRFTVYGGGIMPAGRCDVRDRQQGNDRRCRAIDLTRSWLIIVLLLGLAVRAMRQEGHADSTASKAATQHGLS